MPFLPPLPNHILRLPAYVPGRTADGVARQFFLAASEVVKLASNENPLGMSPAARTVLTECAGILGRYPDSDGYELKKALGEALAVDSDWLTLGNGSCEILEMTGRAFLAPGRAGVVSRYCFSVYLSAIKVTGAEAVVAEAVDFGHDLEAMAASVRPETALIFVANPNNPTGTFFDQRRFESFLGAVDRRTVVVLDEAYREYLPFELQFDSVALVKRHPNLIVSRTFSKAYGLAGLRVGYALAQPLLTAALNRVRPAFNVNTVAQAAARAALDDLDFLRRTRQLNDEGLAFFEDLCRRLGIEYVSSKGNFLLMRVGDADGVNGALLERGVVVRPVANYGLPEWLRVSTGLPDENRRFGEALEEVLGPA